MAIKDEVRYTVLEALNQFLTKGLKLRAVRHFDSPFRHAQTDDTHHISVPARLVF
jgi:hypothetical protein